MMYAAQHGHVAIVQALQREKANPDLGDKVYSFLGTMAEVYIYRIYLSGVVIERRDGAHVCGSRRPHSHRGDVVGVQRRSQSPRQGVFALACSVWNCHSYHHHVVCFPYTGWKNRCRLGQE
jgi:hypothetical protein